MSWVSPELVPLAARLAPYARDSLAQAAALAARLHSEELSPEHWLAALLKDESCAATRAVLHAFADPETIGIEVQALCAGIMVVGSDRTLPFSVLGVEALHAARRRAVKRAAERVAPDDLFLAAHERLPGELRQRLRQLQGADPSAATTPSSPAATVLEAEGPLFRKYSSEALRALGASSRAAASLLRPAIGPAHLMLGALEVDEGLRERTGLTPLRVRMLSSGLDEDTTPLPARRLPGDRRLLELLDSLPAAAETLDVLGWMLAHGSEELTALLRRQKVTQALFERCRGAFRDPELPV
ncbi:MAG: hypothetical protein EXS08_14585 [Planctomycetes bacterium]|nr:hypothetical protein [Planctomycetota bacterium]